MTTRDEETASHVAVLDDISDKCIDYNDQLHENEISNPMIIAELYAAYLRLSKLCREVIKIKIN